MLYEISGNQDSPAILMFPGSFGSARSMQGYIDLLKENYYVIAVTLDGCDGSGNSYNHVVSSIHQSIAKDFRTPL